MKTKIYSFIFLFLICYIKCQIVDIPDSNLKFILVTDSRINSNNDNEIQVSEANAYNGEIDCSNKNISSLKGIEAFTNLTSLICWANNNLTNLDLTKNVALEILDCSGLLIPELNLNNNIKLKYLQCSNMPLTSLNLTKNVDLEELYIEYTNFTTIDLSKNIALKNLQCSFSSLTSLDLTHNIALEYFYSYSNALNGLDVSKNINLLQLVCSGANLVNLDISKNTALKTLWCFNDKLISLNLKNGNNANINSMMATTNPDLKCILVDNVANTSGYNWIKDDTASYSTNCSLGVFDNEKSKVKVFPNPTKGTLNFTEQINVKIYNTVGQKIQEEKHVSSINIDKLPNGVYIIVLLDDNGNEIVKQKIVKE